MVVMSGVHIVGDVGRFEGLLRTWAQNGLQAVLSVKPEGSNGALLRSILPNGTLVGRITNNSTLRDTDIQQRYEADPKAAAAWIFSLYLPTMILQLAFTCWQFQNEPVFGNDPATRLFRIRRLCEFMRELIDLANARGFGVALFNFARGTPEPHEWIHFHEVWRYALSKNRTLPPGRKNLLCLHQYGSFNKAGPGSLFWEEAWHIKRFEMQVRSFLPADLKTAEYLINESGPDGGQQNLKGWKEVYGQNDAGRQALVTDWRIYNEWLATQTGCLGACFFTLGQEGSFDSFNIENDPVAQMLANTHYPTMKPATTQPTPPPPVPVPPTPPLPVPPYVIDTSRRSPNFDERPAGIAIDTIVLHHTGGSFQSSLNWLTNPTSGVSTHYLISKTGKIYRLVDEIKTAWHAGVSAFEGREDVNRFSVGIELENKGDGIDPYPAKLLDALVWLLGDLKTRRNIKRSKVTTHAEVAVPAGRKNDPKGLDVEAVLNRVYGTPVPVPPPVLPDFSKIVWQGEDAMRAEEREGRTQNAEWIRLNWVEPAIRERDRVSA